MKNSYFILLLFCICFSSKAQEPYAQHFSLSNGLPSNSVYSILEDKKGFIWFTCNEGLYRYDGTHFKSYKAKNQSSYAGSSLMQDTEGRIWYQNFDGNSFYIEDQTLKEFPQSSVSNFFPLKSTKTYIFIQEKGNIVAVNVKTLKVIKRFKTNNFVYAAAVLNGIYYFIDGKILYSIDSHLQKQKVVKTPLFEIEFPYLIEGEKDLFLTKKTSLKNGIWKLEGNSFTKIINLSSNKIIQNTRSIKNHAYLFTTSGFFQYDLTSKKMIDHSFISKNITDAIIDRKGNHWITSTLDGIDVVPDMKVRDYKVDNLQPVRSIRFQNKLLISSKNDKVLWFDPKTSKFDEFSSGNSNALPYYLFIDSLRKQMVCVKSDGFTCFSDISTKKTLHKAVIAIKKIVTLDHKYNAFVASGFIGFYLHKNDLKKSSSYDSSIQKLDQRIEGEFIFYRVPVEGRGKSIFFDQRTGYLYFITNTGTYSWKNGNQLKPVFDGKSNMLHEVFVWNNQLMAFGIDGTIFQLNEKNLNSSTKNKILNQLETVKQVQVIDEKLYIRTLNQIVVFENSSQGITELFTSFNLKNIECNDFTIIEDVIWIMTSNGFIQSKIISNKKQKISGLFQLTTLRINGEPVDKLSNQILDYTQNNLNIDFALLDYGVSSISNVEYKINNQRWVLLDPALRTLSFPSLSDGNYTISIRGKVNSKLVTFEQFSFTIKPPFWTTIWFQTLVFLTLTSLIIWYFRIKMKTTRLRNKLINEKIVLESNLNKSLLASIKSQMNPHFIFNALNTIQAYIYMNDKENASGYLSKFSKLTRSVLEMSEKDEIFLSEDLTALKLYLDLEKMRFQDGFEYTIETPNFNPESVKIPSMLLQPYVENAIKHGLLHSENDKKLSILIQKEAKALIVTIDDNGIGRKRAEQLKLKRDEYNEGFSSQANETRLNLLNENTAVSVVYTDKFDENGQATGTTVQLKIQLKK